MGLFSDAECVTGHMAYISDRGGNQRLGQLLDISSIAWQRNRDSMSEATLRIQGSACSAQGAFLEGIEPKRHELVIYRGGDRVWEGPVWRVAWHADYVEINAKDIFAYFLGTPLSKGYSNATPNITEVTTRIAAILDYELPVWEALTPPANILPFVNIHHFDNEARTSAVTTPFQYTVGEHIQSLARYSGVDFVVAGRAFHVWDVSRDLGTLRTMTDADFEGGAIITAYGADHAQHAYVVGRDGLYGEAHNLNHEDYYGPWTNIVTNFDEEGSEGPTQAELNSQASRALTGRSPVPTEVRVPDNSTIRLSHDLTINDLIPGVHIPLRATLGARQLSQVQKLDILNVSETGDGGEKIQITLVPATKPDEDEEED